MSLYERKNLLLPIFLIALYFILVYFDYSNYGTYNWTENLIQSAVITIVFGLLMWLTKSKKK